jgi:hypothetical protein
MGGSTPKIASVCEVERWVLPMHDASITCFSTYAVLFVSEKTSLSSVSDSKLYISQYSGQAELRRLTLNLTDRQAVTKTLL